MGGQRGPQAASEHHDAIAVDILPASDGVVDRQRVGGERTLAGRAFAGAIAAVIDRYDRPFARPARIGKRGRDFLGIAAEVDDQRRRT